LFDENDNIKLSDLGVSKRLGELSTYNSTTAGTNTVGVGTAHWMAPEVVMGEKYGRKADIWYVAIVYRRVWNSANGILIKRLLMFDYL